jgi:hypothetical protein
MIFHQTVDVPADVSFTPHADAARELSPPAVEFIAGWQRTFDSRRRDLLGPHELLA